MIPSDCIPCPACPDGSVWTAHGPTDAICPTCGGHAAVRADGSRIDQDEDAKP